MAITTKTPVRTVFDASNAAIGLAEFQTDEVVSITHGGTSGNSISSAKLALSLTDSNIRSLFSVSGSGSFDNATGIITVTGGVTSVGGATGTVSNAQIASSITTSGLLTTANVAELNNIYFTNARVYSNVTQLGYATTTYVNTQLANLVDSAPAALDTLNELAAALGNDNNFSATVITQLGNKANTSSLTTANVAEVTNLYYTNARVYSAVTGNLALKANLTDKLNVFGSTTSAELAGVISDETGSGLLVFNASPTFTGTVNAAEINASGNVTSPFFYSQSDINLKKDLVHVTNALDIVKLLDGYWFKWKNNDADSIGLIAQHVESVLPMLIGTSPDGSKTVQYNGIIAILLEAIKAQQVQIDEIKAKLNENI